ncbi:MAG: NTP transferase domain-containing protein [Chloroflexi bacterium]|nr:NTP transferase domain-containing protein [Chloroflexota bacterium]
MAGHSRRFQAAGYTVPKPFILIDGRPMIERVCRMFSPQDEFVFICGREHLQAEPAYRDVLRRIAPKTHIVEIATHECGPLVTALAAEEVMAEDEPVIVSYCDFTMGWNYEQFLLKAALYDGAIPVFRDFHPASFGDTYYCYIRTNEELEMIALREKQSFTDNRVAEFASTGVYYVDQWRTFKRYAQEVIAQEQKVAAEYYASLIYPLMVRDGRPVCVYEVEKFICWGTPEDLAEYTFWSEYFAQAS